jgi:hypothetical protein
VYFAKTLNTFLALHAVTVKVTVGIFTLKLEIDRDQQENQPYVEYNGAKTGK